LHQQAERALAEQAVDHAATVSAIRSYAIHAHREGEFCRDGLNTFLEAFGLAIYEPDVQVSYELLGTVTVCGPDIDTVAINVLDALRPSFTLLSQVIEASDNHVAALRDIKPVDLGDDRTGFVARFIVTGEYGVNHPEAYAAESDGRRHLQPSLDGLAGVVPGSLSFGIENLFADLTD
jgi:hypothetical protein